MIILFFDRAPKTLKFFSTGQYFSFEVPLSHANFCVFHLDKIYFGLDFFFTGPRIFRDILHPCFSRAGFDRVTANMNESISRIAFDKLKACKKYRNTFHKTFRSQLLNNSRLVYSAPCWPSNHIYFNSQARGLTRKRKVSSWKSKFRRKKPWIIKHKCFLHFLDNKRWNKRDDLLYGKWHLLKILSIRDYDIWTAWDDL